MALGLMLLFSSGARADAFTDYHLVESFNLPAGASVFAALSDGRIMTLVLADVYVEDAPGARTFSFAGTLPDADLPSFGASFLRVSPDGTKIAVGNNGGASFADFEVGVFDIATLTGAWSTAESFDAVWINNLQVALSAGSFTSGIVTALDTSSPDPANPTNPTVIAGIGGASAGLAIDGDGRLYAGNGSEGSGPSGTGTVKAFASSLWMPALAGGPPADFEADGVVVVDVLSAASLGFDAEGHFHVGGGDVFGSVPDTDYAALVRASVVADALAGGAPADPVDPAEVRRLDPETDNPPESPSFYSVGYNDARGELYLRTGGPVFVYSAVIEPVPAASDWGLAIMVLTMLVGGSVALRRHRRAGGVL